MDRDRLVMLSLAEASSLLKQRVVSPVDFVEAALRRISVLQPKFNAFITVLGEQALAHARNLENELANGLWRGPLHGIPVALKDLFYMKGVRTTAGSKILSDFVPDYDSTVAERLRRAGAILVGKTNTHEFAFGPTNENSYFGPVRNPWDPSRISGGSSGGSAVAVATGMAYVALGTDTGGSVRIPACLCGVVGFKPTYGIVSLHGVVPLSFSFDHAGPIARSVKDIALSLDVIAGSKDEEENSPDGLGFAEALAQAEADDLSGLAIGVPTNFYFEKVEPEVEDLVRAAIQGLAEMGAVIREVRLPGLGEVPRVTTTIMFAEAAYFHREYLTSRPEDYSPDVRGRLEFGSKITAVEYIEAMKQREVIKRAYESLFEEVHVIVTPTLPIPAYKIGSTSVEIRGSDEPAREILVRHTRLANLTGAPALTVPCGMTREGLPVGLQIMGRPYDDATVLKVGWAYERRYPWKLWTCAGDA